MSILFMGGEDIDFPAIVGNVTLSTSSSAFRSAYARCALRINGGAELNSYARAPFAQASSNFWFSTQIYFDQLGFVSATGRVLYGFYSEGKIRLAIRLRTGPTVELVKYDDAGVATILATAAANLATGLHRHDVKIDYAGGRVILYLDQVIILDYTGSVTSGGSTTLDQFVLGPGITDGSYFTSFSEIIIIERDTRTLNLKTHVPTSTGSTNTWTGTFADIDDVTANTSDMAYSDVADAVGSFGVTDLPTGSFSVRGFKVSAYAARGVDGPTGMELGVTSGGSSSFGTTQAVDSAWGKFGQTFETNPVTGNGFTAAEINAIEIAVKAKT